MGPVAHISLTLTGASYLPAVFESRAVTPESVIPEHTAQLPFG